MSASDTSSEENQDLLREAVDGQFINDSMFASSGTGATYKGWFVLVSIQIIRGFLMYCLNNYWLLSPVACIKKSDDLYK
jgi:hypothetical protein